MAKIDLSTVVDTLKAADSFLITTHTNPDGDAIGSVLALRSFLEAMGKERIVCACQDPVPKLYRWLNATDTIVDHVDPCETFDLVVIVDVGRLDRIGTIADSIPSDQKILVLDHHLEDSPSGTLHYIDATYAAAAEIIVDVFTTAGVELSREAAECAYVGLTTDTGGFRYSNTNPAAHRRAALLLEAGIDVFDISSRVFDLMSFAKFDLLRRVVDRTEVEMDGRCAHSAISASDMREAQATGEDVNGLVNFIRNLVGVKVAVLFRQLDTGEVKVSMRSRDGFNSAEALKPLGGGGHAGAAGATLRTSLEEARATVLATIREALGQPV